MKRATVMAVAVAGLLTLAVASLAQAKNDIYGVKGSTLEGDGYKLFASDAIAGTLSRAPLGKVDDPTYCGSAELSAVQSLGDPAALRSDSRLGLPPGAAPSYAAACRTYAYVVGELKGAEAARRLWLLFGDSLADPYAEETEGKLGINDDTRFLVESKRLAVVGKYLEFFLKNRAWKLSDYTFLSQAVKARRGKPLSPAFGGFVSALLTGDSKRALGIVNAIDLENLGSRFTPPPPAGAKH